jgi:hypothetical protein
MRGIIVAAVVIGLISISYRAYLIERSRSRDENVSIWNAKYGNYYRNLHGIIEHTHYHLGQIVLIKKLLKRRRKSLTVHLHNIIQTHQQKQFGYRLF